MVEVKKEGNTDTRRVIAQLLDYASALWGLTLDEFEHRVLRSRLASDDQRTLAEFVRDELIDEAEDPDEATVHTCELLADTLRSGDFALVVAAPSVPPGVERQIEYLNARGLNGWRRSALARLGRLSAHSGTRRQGAEGNPEPVGQRLLVRDGWASGRTAE